VNPNSPSPTNDAKGQSRRTNTNRRSFQRTNVSPVYGFLLRRQLFAPLLALKAPQGAYLVSLHRVTDFLALEF
jgi:hypothetical protein